MAAPQFRFVTSSHDAPVADAQFWRDVDASDRMSSRFKANLFLRELCRTKAWEDATLPGSAPDHFVSEHREQTLLREVFARGYRLFGPDLDGFGSVAFADAG